MKTFTAAALKEHASTKAKTGQSKRRRPTHEGQVVIV